MDLNEQLTELTDLKELMADESNAISKNQKLSDEYRQMPLSEKGYSILREFNNPDSGIRMYGEGARFPSISIHFIRKSIKFSEEEFEKELKVLFLKRYIDYSYNMNEEMKRKFSLFPDLSMDESSLKFGTALDIICSKHGSGSFTLTDRGFFAMIDYGLKEMNRLQEVLIPLNEEVKENSLKQEEQLKQIQDNQKTLTDSITESSQLIARQDTLSKKIAKDVGEVENKISKFNENIFTIFSIMIAAFAVIGINISSISNIDDNFVIGILTVNFSLCFSLIVLFYLLKVVVYNEKRTGLERLIIGFGLIFLIGILVQLGVFSQIIELLRDLFISEVK